jgi:hypothetical protein
LRPPGGRVIRRMIMVTERIHVDRSRDTKARLEAEAR